MHRITTTVIAAAAATCTAAAANAELLQIEFSAGVTQPVTPIVIDGVPGTAALAVTGVVTWDTDQTPFSDNGLGYRRWSNASFQAVCGGSILLDNGEIIPVSFVINNTTAGSFSNALVTNHFMGQMASDATWASYGGEFASCDQYNGSISIRTAMLDALPSAVSPLPTDPADYQLGADFWQVTVAFDIERPGGGTDTVHISTSAFGVITHDMITITPSVAGELPPQAAFPADSADINGDGLVDTADLGVLLGQFGTTPSCN